MIPILYAKNTEDFDNNGIGVLTETVKATVTEERNGSFELSFQYPISGRWFNQIEDGCIIKAKSNETGAAQLFRIYKSSKPLKGIVTYSAEHISYDLSGLVLAGFSAENVNAQEAIEKALEETPLSHKFTAFSDITTKNKTAVTAPCTVRQLLGGISGSILDVWGGEYEFDNYTIKLLKQRGKDAGVCIEYGKNLMDIKQDTSTEECYTHVMPYAVLNHDDGTGTYTDEYIYLPEIILPLRTSGDMGAQKAYIYDFSDKFGMEETPTAEKLRAFAQEYVKTTERGTIPKISITVSFVQLWQTEEYKNVAPLERVSLCDTVNIRYEKLGILAKAKVIKTIYDVLREKYDKIELGDVRSSFAAQAAQQAQEVEELKEQIKTEQTKTNNAVRELKQEFTAADGKLLSTITETLKNYSTLEETRSTIKQTSDNIMLEVNKKVNDSDLGTKIEQNYEAVKIAWNNISNYVEFSGGALKIYESAFTKQLLMEMTSTGAWYYNDGVTIGKIGTNHWDDDDTFRGLVFDLEDEADYMTWAARLKPDDPAYTVRFSYYANNRKYTQGLHFSCQTYFLNGVTTTSLLNCYDNIDLHDSSILNQSDARLKENIEDTGINALDIIKGIELKSFDWIESGKHEDIGFIAQQVQEILPELVDENADTGRLSVKSDKFIPYLVKAVQELAQMQSGEAQATATIATTAATARKRKKAKWKDNYTKEEKRQFVEQNKPPKLPTEPITFLRKEKEDEQQNTAVSGSGKCEGRAVPLA